MAIIGLFCVGLTIAHNCEQLGHSPLDHSAAASQQSYSSSNFISTTGQGVQSQQSYDQSHDFNNYNSNTNGNGNSRLYSPGNLRNDLPENTPYWWMNNPSPFKNVVTGVTNFDSGCNPTKGCKAASAAIDVNKATYYKMDLSQNPFINGNYFASESNKNHHQTLTGQSVQSDNINLSNNPFISGQATTANQQTASHNTQTHGEHTGNSNTHLTTSNTGSGSSDYNSGASAAGSVSKPIDFASNPFFNSGSSSQQHQSTTGNGVYSVGQTAASTGAGYDANSINNNQQNSLTGTQFTSGGLTTGSGSSAQNSGKFTSSGQQVGSGSHFTGQSQQTPTAPSQTQTTAYDLSGNPFFTAGGNSQFSAQNNAQTINSGLTAGNQVLHGYQAQQQQQTTQSTGYVYQAGYTSQSTGSESYQYNSNNAAGTTQSSGAGYTQQQAHQQQQHEQQQQKHEQQQQSQQNLNTQNTQTTANGFDSVNKYNSGSESLTQNTQNTQNGGYGTHNTVTSSGLISGGYQGPSNDGNPTTISSSSSISEPSGFVATTTSNQNNNLNNNNQFSSFNSQQHNQLHEDKTAQSSINQFASSNLGYQKNNNDYTSDTLIHGFYDQGNQGQGLFGPKYGSVDASKGYLPPQVPQESCNQPQHVCLPVARCSSGSVSASDVPRDTQSVSVYIFIIS